MTSRHISLTTSADAETVYRFAADPNNLPAWASGLARAEVRAVGESLWADSPMGTVKVTFAPRNDFGVLDHDVELPDGVVVNNPLRVLRHPEGAEIVFTVRQLDMTDEELERDCRTVREDLGRLRDLVEAQSR